MTNHLAEKQAIMDQLFRYCRSVDRLDVALGYSVFHPNSNTDFGVFKGTGRGWIDYVCSEHRKYLHHQHQITNALIEVSGDVAGSESYVTATLRALDGEKLMQRQFWARYIDRWSNREGHWAIDSRQCVIDFASVCDVTALVDHQNGRRDTNDPSYEVFPMTR
jgi:SnoaL-like domain